MANIDGRNIDYCSVEDIGRISEEVLTESIVICDEVDQSMTEKTASVAKVGKHYHLFYLPHLLGKAHRVIGFSGTLTDTALSKLKINDEGFVSINVPLLVEETVNLFQDFTDFKNSEEREEKILAKVKEVLDSEKSVILIDKRTGKPGSTVCLQL